MYQLFGIRAFLSTFGIASGLVVAVLAWVMPPTHLSDVWHLITGSVMVLGLLMVVIGQTPLFPILCRLPPGSWFLPDIDGHWRGTMESNWPEIMKRSGLLQPGNTSPSSTIPTDFKIIARLFHVRLNQVSVNHYTNSKTIFVKINRDPEDGEVRLTYVYEASTPKPEPTDSTRHHGAGYLDLKRDKLGPPTLEGVYWTNRNWHKTLNTAGRIVLRRA
jgi:hypothetical protein